jgi:hypothetical protein
MNYLNRHRHGRTMAVALAASLMTIATCGIAACGVAASRPTGAPTSGTAMNCPAAAPVLVAPLTGTRPPALPPGAVTAAICQYAPSLPAGKAASAPVRRLVLRGEAADGLRAVLAGTDPMTPHAARCGRPAALLPFEQVIYFSYRHGPTARAAVTFTSCQLAVVAAAGRFGLLPSPVQDDLFGYTLITAHDRGPLVSDVIGLPATKAATVAARHHFALAVDGQAVDPQVPSGTVIFQVLPPAVPDAGPSPHALGTIVAVSVAADCQVRQLRLTYRGGGAGAGNDFGQIMFRDVGATPCRLAGRLELTGVDAAGHPVTNTVTGMVAAPGVLGPHTAPVRDLAAAPPGAMIYAWLLTAEYRDDAATPNGLCAAHVTPVDWRVRLPGGSIVVTPNADRGSAFRLLGPSGGLVTCRGRLGAMSDATFS